MSTAYIILAIAVSAAVTFMLRALPFAAFRGEKTMPAWLEIQHTRHYGNL